MPWPAIASGVALACSTAPGSGRGAAAVDAPGGVAEQQAAVVGGERGEDGVVGGVQVGEARVQRLDREVRAEHAAFGPERLDDAVQPGTEGVGVPVAEDRADGVDAGGHVRLVGYP